jgi:hypothetical protein
MATTLERNGILEITSIAADWDYKASRPTNWPEKPRLTSIKFNPGAADDKLTIKEQNDGGPECFFCLCQNTYDQRIEYYHGQRIIPYIDFSACTLSAGHSVIIKIWRDI